MKFINGAIVMTNAEEGKPFGIMLSAAELNLVLAVVQGLHDGKLRAQEIAPFILRGVNVSEERARQIIAEQDSLPKSITEALVGKEVRLRITKRTNMTGLPPQQIPKDTPAAPCAHEWISSQGRTASGVLCAKCGEYNPPEPAVAVCWYCGKESRQRLIGGDWRCSECDTRQCERQTCKRCHIVLTRPNGEHYCHKGQEACEHETIIAGRCITCDKVVRRR